jgi:transketolase
MAKLEPDNAKLASLAQQVRRTILEISYNSKSGHIGSAFSAADMLTALYFHCLRVDPQNPADAKRDRFIMSKGHACAALYSVLHLRGYFDRAFLDGFGKDSGTLGHHPDRNLKRGIEATTGSLGHGLSMAAGLALAAKKDQAAWRSVVMLSDGEINEGSVWEAALFAGHHKLDNLLAIVDCNRIQALGFTDEIARFCDLEGVWKSFGWGVRKLDGHNMDEIVAALDSLPYQDGKPSVILANTVKGKGVSFMEDQLLWHYRCPDEKEYRMAMEELKAHA